MTNIARDEPMIERALDLEKMFMLDYKQRIAYICDMRAMLDKENHDRAVKRQALEEGKAEGRAEGKTEGKTEVAENLLRMGESIDRVARATGLSEEEVRDISNQLDQI